MENFLKQRLLSSHPSVVLGALESLQSVPLTPGPLLELLLDGLAESVMKADGGVRLFLDKIAKGELEFETLVNGLLKRTQSGSPSLVRAAGKLMSFLVTTDESFGKEQQDNLASQCLISMLLRRPDFWPFVLSEMSRIARHSSSVSCLLKVLGPVFKASFCHSGLLKQDTLWHCHVHSSLVSWALDVAGNKADRVLLILQLVLSVNDEVDALSVDAPLRLSLQSILLESAVVLYNRLIESKEKIRNQILFALMGLTASMYHYQLPIQNVLQRLQDFSQAQSLDKDMAISVSLLACYLLLDPPKDTECIQLLVDLLSDALETKALDSTSLLILCRLALYPILKTSADDWYPNSIAKESCMKSLHIVQTVLASNHELAPERWTDLASNTRHLSASILSLARILPQLHTGIYSLESLDLPIKGISQLLVMASLANHQDDSIAQSALLSLSSDVPSSMCLVSLLLYHSQHGSIPSRNFILTKSLPVLTRHSDPFIVTVILRTISNLSNPNIKLMALYHLWIEYPRSFVKLRAHLGEMIQKWRLAHVKDKTTEQAIVSTLRLCCMRENPNTEELLSLVVTCLSFHHFSDVSKSMLIDSLCLLIGQDAIDTYSVWKVTLVPFLSENRNPTDRLSMGLISFYDIVGSIENGSESYAEFRIEIVEKYLLPLTKHDNPLLASRACASISKFPIEILEKLFATPADTLNTPKTAILSRLISQESTTMGKALFKGLKSHTVYHEKDDMDKLLYLKTDTVNTIKSEWLKGRLIANKKGGFAIVALLCSLKDTNDSLYSDSIVRQAVKDISIDSEYQSFDAVSFWTGIWKQILLDRYEALELPSHSSKVLQLSVKVEEAINHIVYNELTKSTSPNQTANLLYSITALTLCGDQLGLPRSPDQSLNLAKLLYEESQNSSSALLVEDHVLNDEIQRAMILCLGSLAEILQPHHCSLVLSISNFILTEAQVASSMSRKQACFFILPKVFGHISEISMAEFISCSRIFVDQLLMNTDIDESLKRIGLQSFFSSLSCVGSDAKVQVMALYESLFSEPRDLESLIFRAYQDGSQNELITSIDSFCENKRGSSFLTAASLKGILLNNQFSKMQDSETQSALHAWGSTLLGLFGSSKESTQTRVKALLAFIPFLGMQYGYGPNPLRMPRKEITAYIDTLTNLILSDHEPKVVRLSGTVLAKVLMCIGLKTESIFGATQMREPSDFSRLSHEKSYLRALFDSITRSNSEEHCKSSLHVLLDIQAPLPNVDWAPAMDSLLKRYPSLGLDIFFFASKHSLLSCSRSLTKVFTALLEELAGEEQTFKDIVASADGIGRLLGLAGLIDSDDSLFSPLLSHSHCLEIVKKLVLQSFPMGASHLIIKVIYESLQNKLQPQPLGKQLATFLVTILEDLFVSDSKSKSVPPESIEMTISLTRIVLTLREPEEKVIPAILCGHYPKSGLSFWCQMTLFEASLLDVSLLSNMTNSLQYAFTESYHLSQQAASALRTCLFTISEQVVFDWILRLLDILILYLSSKDWIAILRIWDLGLLNAFSVLSSQKAAWRVLPSNKPAKEFKKIRNWSSTLIQIHRESVLFFIREEWTHFSPEFRSSVQKRLLKALDAPVPQLQKDLQSLGSL